MKRNLGPIYVTPAGLWIVTFFAFPILIIVLYSFMSKTAYGGVKFVPTLAAYSGLFNPTFLKVTLGTLQISVAATALMVSLAIPAAYYIARSKWRSALLLLIIIPFWTNFLIRVYAWIAILGNNGLVNNTLVSLGLWREHVQLLYNKGAVIVVTVYAYLPYAILPLYASIEKFDFSLLEAARDLGATKSQALLKILMPGISAGITTAVLFTFIPVFGSYAIPQIVGGKDSFMLGNIIARELTITRNWPLASSISVVLTCFTTVGVLLFMRLNRNPAESARRSA
jgi:spermidine/putrescine transport system permease protein